MSERSLSSTKSLGMPVMWFSEMVNCSLLRGANTFSSIRGNGLWNFKWDHQILFLRLTWHSEWLMANPVVPSFFQEAHSLFEKPALSGSKDARILFLQWFDEELVRVHSTEKLGFSVQKRWVWLKNGRWRAFKTLIFGFFRNLRKRLNHTCFVL